MTREIRKCYHYLDLPYNSTEEEVRYNEKAMIKIARAKAIKTGKNSTKRVQQIATSSDKVLDYIKKNGVGEEHQFYKPSTERLSTLIFALVLFIIMFVSSLVAILQ